MIEGVLDILKAVGLEKPDIPMLPEEFLAEMRSMPQRNLAFEPRSCLRVNLGTPVGNTGWFEIRIKPGAGGVCVRRNRRAREHTGAAEEMPE